MAILGLDVGGAAIKAADSRGQWAECRKFALWKQPEKLVDQLRTIEPPFPIDRIAVTMTGELCDCFATKADGVAHIVAAVQAAFSRHQSKFWMTDGKFVDAREAIDNPWNAGASNWSALAHLACRRFLSPRANDRETPSTDALLLDLGSTTCDVIPIRNGRPAAVGRNDPDRLASGELVYLGVERTPLCALLDAVDVRGRRYPVMAELFATTLDAYLVLGLVEESESGELTADSAPATQAAAVARLARMIGSDASRFDLADATCIARQVRQEQIRRIRKAIEAVIAASLPNGASTAFTSGQGEFLLEAALGDFPGLATARQLSLNRTLSPMVSTAACAYAVADLLDSDLSQATEPMA